MRTLALLATSLVASTQAVALANDEALDALPENGLCCMLWPEEDYTGES